MVVCTKVVTLQNMQIAFGVCQVSYSLVMRDILPGGKGAEV